MHQLLPGDFSLLEPLFVAAAPANAPMLRAFLDGRVPGHAFVDAMPVPTAAVAAVNYRFVFFGGAPSRPFLETAVRQLRYQQSLDIVWPATPAKFPPGFKPDEVVARVEYTQRRDRGPGDLDGLLARAPHAEVKRIDSRNIAHCLWREDVLRAIGSTSEFLGHGLGFCLLVDEAIVAEAYAVIWSGSRAELATVTHPKHRGRGYGTVLCASLIKACEAVDLETYWNCDVGNRASMRLAARLGYAEPREYRLARFTQQAPVAKYGKQRRPRTLVGFARKLFSRVAGRGQGGFPTRRCVGPATSSG